MTFRLFRFFFATVRGNPQWWFFMYEDMIKTFFFWWISMWSSYCCDNLIHFSSESVATLVWWQIIFSVLVTYAMKNLRNEAAASAVWVLLIVLLWDKGRSVAAGLIWIFIICSCCASDVVEVVWAVSAWKECRVSWSRLIAINIRSIISRVESVDILLRLKFS